MKIKEYTRKYNWIVVLVLFVLGLALLWRAKNFEEESFDIYILMINLGAASIVTGVAILILSFSVGGIEETFEREIAELTSKLDILPEAKKCGIVHVFKSRRDDPNYKKKLINQFEDVNEGEEVLLMSISLRDFFLPRSGEEDYLNAIFNMLKKDITFRILLLDPTSDAAQDRAIIEEKEIVEKKGYTNTTLFTQIKNVAARLDDSSIFIDDQELQNRIKNQIKVRFYPSDPTTHLIITDKFTFIEQYHRGGDKKIRKYLQQKKIPSIDCIGGFVPVLMVENSAFFSKLMQSHFDNIWRSKDVEESDLRKKNYYQIILKFEDDEKTKSANFR
jgi:hypothetical protein